MNFSCPSPPILGDKQQVYLDRLFMVVKEKGGYDAVSHEKLWHLVGEECGLGLSIGPAIKLVYNKYLCSIDASVNKVVKSKVAHEYDLVDERDKSKKRWMELQVESIEFLSSCAEHGVDADSIDWRKLCVSNRSFSSFGSGIRGVFKKGDLESRGKPKSWQILNKDNLGKTAYNLRKRRKYNKRPRRLGIISRPRTKGHARKQLLDSPSKSKAKVEIPMGPKHQVEVPQWTDEISESDSKWLGTRVWPPSEKLSPGLLIERDPIGKGRQDSCACVEPGSVECVRFHIREKRARVKLELGVAFKEWNFDNVGEEARHLWTVKDQNKFEDAMRSNPPSSNRYYWDNIFEAFPGKAGKNWLAIT